MAQARENTVEAFQLALRLGATGIESDVWLTADGQVVLDHDGVVGRRPSRQPISDVPRAALPAHIVTLEEFYAACGIDFELSLDVKEPRAFSRVVEIARAAGGDAQRRLWLCHDDLVVVSSWRRLARDIHIVDSTRAGRITEGVNQRAVTLAQRGIDAINLPWRDWDEHLIEMVHEVGVCVFAWDAQRTTALNWLIGAGADAIYSDHVERMVKAVTAAYPRPS
jgi:glycerophosphoryl diester phosphodiesterase